MSTLLKRYAAKTTRDNAIRCAAYANRHPFGLICLTDEEKTILESARAHAKQPV